MNHFSLFGLGLGSKAIGYDSVTYQHYREVVSLRCFFLYLLDALVIPELVTLTL